MSSAPLMCSLCAGPITVSIVIPCQHDQVCGVCIARMRVLQKKDQCAFCKVKWDYCIFTTNRASRKPWNSYDLNSLTYDKFYCVYFDSIALFEWFKKLRSLYCVVCERTDHSSLSADLAVVAASNAVTDQYSKTTYFQSVKQLKNHLDHDHKKFLCPTCLDHREHQAFIHEYRIFSKYELDQHIQQGSPSSADFPPTAAHPTCEHCSVMFFSQDELDEHLVREHFSCHFCQKTGGSQNFYRSYQQLERHFRQAHFLCEDADCLDKKFVVFEDQLALQAHKYSYHTDKSGMSQADRRNASRLNIHFNVAGSASAAFNTPAAPAPAPSAGRNTRTFAAQDHRSEFPSLGNQAVSTSYVPGASAVAAVATVQEQYPSLRPTPSRPAANPSSHTSVAPSSTPSSAPSARPSTSGGARDAAYLPMPEPCPAPLISDRNALLVSNIKHHFNNDENLFAEFRRTSALYRRGTLDAAAYFKEFAKLFTGDQEEAESILMQLIALLPDADKRQELHAAYVKHKTAPVSSGKKKEARAESKGSSSQASQPQTAQHARPATARDSLRDGALTAQLRKQVQSQVDAAQLLDRNLIAFGLHPVCTSPPEVLSRQHELHAIIQNLNSQSESFKAISAAVAKANEPSLLDLTGKHNAELGRLRELMQSLQRNLVDQLKAIQQNKVKEQSKSDQKQQEQLAAEAARQKELDSRRQLVAEKELAEKQKREMQERADFELALKLSNELELQNVPVSSASANSRSVLSNDPPLGHNDSTSAQSLLVISSDVFNVDLSVLPISDDDRSRLLALICSVQVAATYLSARHGKHVARLSGGRRKTIVANVQRVPIRDIADMSPLGKLGVRPATCSTLASFCNRGANRATLNDWLTQSLQTVSSDELYMIFEYFSIVLTRFCDPNSYSQSRAAQVVTDSLQVLKKKDDDDLVMFSGNGKRGKK